MTDQLAHRVKNIASNEDGMSVVEMVVAVMLMAIAAAIYLNFLTSVYTGVGRQQKRSDINDEARLAIEQMDREIRSGNYLSNPQTESFTAPTCGGYACAPNFSVRVLTQANATTRTPPQQCVQWLIEGRRLMRRSWTYSGGVPVVVEGWRVVATDVVNRDVSPQVPAFVRATGARVLDVTLVVNNRLGQADAPRTVRIASSIAIRNSTSQLDPCSPIPSS